MGYQARLEWGGRRLNLNSGPYALGMDFGLPAVEKALQMGAGSSANRLRGGSLRGFRLQDREVAFTVRVTGSSSAETHLAARRLTEMLELAGQAGQTLYLAFRPDTAYAFEPTWGEMGATLRVEVKSGRAGLAAGGWYGQGELRSYALLAAVRLVCGPAAVGARLQLAEALGGVVDDRIGSEGWWSRGLVVGEATTNVAKNPIFMFDPYDYRWSAGSSLEAYRNGDPDYLLPMQMQNVRVTSRSSTNNAYYQSLTLTGSTTYQIWMIVKRPDAGAVSSGDCQITYNAVDQTCTYTNLGDGYWIVQAGVTGTGSAANTGLTVNNGRSLYLCAMQVEAAAVRSYLTVGSMAGCSWAGTAHDSNSARTAGRVRATALAYSPTEGTVVCGVRMDAPSTDSRTKRLFYMGSSNLSGYIASGTVYLTDGSNTISGSLASWSVGEYKLLHFTWSAGSLKIYEAGAQVATGSSFTPAARGSYVYIGSNNTPTEQFAGVVTGFSVYERAMSAAEAAADYALLSGRLAAGWRLGAIPWLWTKDGDGAVDNGNDSSNDHYALAGGIPGTIEAETEYFLEVDGATVNFDTDQAFWMSRLAVLEASYINEDVLFKDLQGTVVAGRCGGETAGFTVGTTGVVLTAFGGAALGADLSYPDMMGREYNVLAVLADAGSNLMARAVVVTGLGYTSYAGDWQTISADTTYRLFRFGPITVPTLEQIGEAADMDVTLTIELKRSSGASATVNVDFVCAMPSPMIKVKEASALTGVALGVYARISGGRARLESGAAVADYLQDAQVQGQEIELMADKCNYLQCLRSDHGVAHVLARTMTFYQVFVRGRYLLV